MTQSLAPPAATPSSAPSAAAPAPAAHRRCGWIGADTAEAGIATFTAHPDDFDAIHPKFFTLDTDGAPRPIALTDDPRIAQTAKTHHVQLIPLIDSDDPAYIRANLGSPDAIARHAAELADLVQSHGYDGIELDYEHLWTKEDRAPFVELVKETAAALHAHDKVLTLALPAMDHDDGNSAYDYAAFKAAGVDIMHLMAYDYHFLGGDHLGPLAPRGWVEAVAARVQSLGTADRTVLGVANYGIGNGWYASTGEIVADCQPGTYSSVTDHMKSCPYGHPDAGLAPHCTTSKGEAWFEDAGSVAEKAAIAKAHGLRGIGYWTVGGEPPGFDAALRKSY